MSDIKKDSDKGVPDVSGGYTPSPTDGCIVGPGWPPGDGTDPSYPQNPFGPAGPVDPWTDPAQLT